MVRQSDFPRGADGASHARRGRGGQGRTVGRPRSGLPRRSRTAGAKLVVVRLPIFVTLLSQIRDMQANRGMTPRAADVLFGERFIVGSRALQIVRVGLASVGTVAD